MALTKSITSLVADEDGNIATDFLARSDTSWAEEHMTRRYGAPPPEEDDPPDHPARLCYDHLRSEFMAIRNGWFDDRGKLSPLLMSRHLSKAFSGPAGNGIGWDFQPNGEPEPRMLQFKGTLIGCRRAAELRLRATKRPKEDCGSAEMGGITRLVRSAFMARAEVHDWRPCTEGKGDTAVTIQGGEMARRWVSYRTFVFLLQAGAEADWAWSAARCRDAFGHADVPTSLTV